MRAASTASAICPCEYQNTNLPQRAKRICPEVRQAAEIAIRNIRQFAEAQLPRERFEEFSPAANWDGLCGRSTLSDVTSPRDVTRFLRHCS